MIRTLVAAAAVLFAAAPAGAEVVSRSENGFTLKFAVAADVDPADIPAALTALPQWWESAHTYTGDSKNLSLDLTPGGCWCEKLPDNPAFDHGRTVAVADDHITFNAPFGPLRGRASRAELTVTWPEADGVRTPTWVFVVEGPGMGAMADAVDRVIGTGYARWMSHLQTGQASSGGGR